MKFEFKAIKGGTVVAHCILVVEDNLIISAHIAKAITQHLKVDVQVAFNGRQALEAFRASKFSLILMDTRMPVMNGYEAALHIRLQEKSSGEFTPIISMTAEPLENNHLSISTAGTDDVIIKPFGMDELFAKINPWLTHD
jgi:DNA-binding response OmpR family regulator